jgi:DNA-binding beta-propeller fold protein YncE
VTDLNFRVQIFDADGKFLSKFGSVGTGFGQFSMPKGVGVDSQGHIYVVDARFSNVQIFDPQGRLLLFFGELGSRLGEFYLPAGLYVDGQDRIYVADQYNKRIDVFQYIGPKEPTAGTQENNTEREG